MSRKALKVQSVVCGIRIFFLDGRAQAKPNEFGVMFWPSGKYNAGEIAMAILDTQVRHWHPKICQPIVLVSCWPKDLCEVTAILEKHVGGKQH